MSHKFYNVELKSDLHLGNHSFKAGDSVEFSTYESGQGLFYWKNGSVYQLLGLYDFFARDTKAFSRNLRKHFSISFDDGSSSHPIKRVEKI